MIRPCRWYIRNSVSRQCVGSIAMLRALSFLKYGVSIDGLITVWPDDIGSWKWTDRHPDAAARERYDAAFRGLHAFARGFETPAIFGFSSTAQDMFREWMTRRTRARLSVTMRVAHPRLGSKKFVTMLELKIG